MTDDARRRFVECPFFVLDLPPDASRTDVERAAQRLAAELAVGRASATTYATPFGPQERTADLVRAAAAALRDPVTRLGHEVIARAVRVLVDDDGPEDDAQPWGDVIAQLGLGRESSWED